MTRAKTHPPSDTPASMFPASSSLAIVPDRSYAQWSVRDLIEGIVSGDASALNEFITNRQPLKLGGKSVGLLTWLDAEVLRPAKGWNGGDMIPETARDLCQDRFTRLPEQPDGGIDCRYYYDGFLKHLPAELVDGEYGHLHPLVSHTRIMERFCGYVRWQWRLCMRDAWRRQQRLTVVHDYIPPSCHPSPGIDAKLGVRAEDAGEREARQGGIRLRVPVCIPRAERDAWLERCFGPIDVHAPHVIDHLNDQIDQWLTQEMRSRERRLRGAVESDLFGTSGSTLSIERSWSHDGLAQTVAREKANAPKRLRTSIAALGPERIEQLVLRIFADVISGGTSGGYHPASVARDFGLHKSTLTRFAAAHWGPSQQGPVPDLWLNTAQVLAGQACFSKALEEAGLEPVICDLTDPENESMAMDGASQDGQ